MKRFISFFMALFCSFFFLVNSLRAQELTPVFENITEGLPSTEVHDMFQDSIGYMWFATDRGICRYNGDEMKIIDTDKDIPTNVFFKFFKQSETKVWLLTKNTTLYSFNPLEAKPKFRAHPKNSEIVHLINSSMFPREISDAIFSGDDITMLLRRSVGYIHIPEKGHCRWILQQPEYYNNLNEFNQIEICKSNQIYYTQFRKRPKGNPNLLKVPSCEVSNFDLNQALIASDYGISSRLNSKKGTYLSISNQMVRMYKGQATCVDFSKKILCTLELNDKIYIGTYDGIFICDHALTIKGHLLKGACVTKIFLDRDENFWVSTVQYGLYMTKNLKINEYKFDVDFNASDFYNCGKTLMAFDEVKNESYFIHESYRIADHFSNIVLLGNRIVFDDPRMFSYLPNEKPYKWFHDVSNLQWSYSVINANVEFDLTQINRSINRLENNRLSLFYHFKGKINPSFCIKVDGSNLLIGSEKGLFLLNIATKTASTSPIKGSEKISFYSAIQLVDRIIITSSDGIYSYKENRLEKVPKSSTLGIKQVYKLDDTHAFVYNDNSIYRLHHEKNEIRFDSKKYYATEKNAGINSLIVFNNDLWISTKKGTQVINLKEYPISDSKSKYSFIIDSVLIDSKHQTNLTSTKMLEGSVISFFFNSICFDHTTPRKLEYTIDGETWLETNKNSIVISNLSSGEYLLQIRRIDDPSKMLFILPIHVSKIWYQSNWFIGLCSMLIMIFVAFMIFQFFKSRDKKRSAELDKLNLELKLLTSKMNPHFTFNTINSIQYYILKSDKKEAIQYLSDFALLIRKSLDFSMAERITIEEEIHFLSLYVKMENKRFDSNFRLKFDLDPPNIVQSKKIPSMLIQPLVENIILHAGYSEDEDKLINIKIVYAYSFFTLEVIDHGKGIQTKDDFNKHKSYGIDILKSRVKIYNGREFSESDVKLHSSEKGTIVTIKLKEWKQY